VPAQGDEAAASGKPHRGADPRNPSPRSTPRPAGSDCLAGEEGVS